eukprot:6048543-Prymnesium_polylepis.1
MRAARRQQEKSSAGHMHMHACGHVVWSHAVTRGRVWSRGIPWGHMGSRGCHVGSRGAPWSTARTLPGVTCDMRSRGGRVGSHRVTWWSRGGRVVVAWWSRGGRVVVAWRSRGGR